MTLIRSAATLFAVGVLVSGCAQYEKYAPDMGISHDSDTPSETDTAADAEALDKAQASYESDGYTLLASTAQNGEVRVMSYSGPINNNVECQSPGGQNYRIMPPSRRDRYGVEQRFQLDTQIKIEPHSGLFSSTKTESFHVLTATLHQNPASPASRVEVVSFSSDGGEGVLKSGLRCRDR